MADSMQPKRLNINNNIDQSKTVLDSNETTSPGHLDIFSTIGEVMIKQKSDCVPNVQEPNSKCL